MTDISGLSETDSSNTTLSGASVAEGCAPSGINDAIRALAGMLARDWHKKGPYKTSSGTNTVTLTLDTAPASYVQGEVISFIAGGTNTGAATLNVNSLGAKSITKNGTTALTGGEIVSGAVVDCKYDGTQFQLLNCGGIGKQTINIPGSAFTLATSSGAATSQSESSTNKVNRKTADYVDGSTTSASALIPVPKSYNGGTFTWRLFFESSVSSNNMVWGVDILFLRNGDTIDTAFGTQVTQTVACGTSTTLNISGESSAVTGGGTVGANCMMVVRLQRLGGNGSDTNTGTGKVWAVQLYYTTNARDDT